MRETRTAQTSLFDMYAPHKFAVFLRKLSDVLDQHPEILEEVSKDFTKKEVKSTGRCGLSVESVFRCMLLKQITQDSYERLSFHLSDSSTYRAFTRLASNCMPGKSALSENICRLQPQTLENVFGLTVARAVQKGDVDLDLLRLDSTVIKSNIAPPSDSQLLEDGIRVISRLMAKSQQHTGIKLRLTDYRKDAKSLAGRIFYGKQAQKDALYPELIALAKRVVRQSERAVNRIQSEALQDLSTKDWIAQMLHYRHLLERVICQTERRIIGAEKVPAQEKLYSIFEPHTDIIVKDRREISYGHKVNLATDNQGLITAFRIEAGNPSDTERYLPLINQHKERYGKLPTTTIADGGYASLDNIKKGQDIGVAKVAFHKKRGIHVSAMGIKEKTLRRLRNFRAGIEGNISELKRAFGASKALWKSEKGFKCFVWVSVISYNLTRLVRIGAG